MKNPGYDQGLSFVIFEHIIQLPWFDEQSDNHSNDLSHFELMVFFRTCAA
ncbi:hypothetical protein ACFODZ_04680 [Marinicella sediminis]|uniref:Uncharacterized protein n=1 Tax=Marinicella sediminis TaxID=1792834 RepID=A0ABV7J6F0_9GAMM|nr:hypothetical protein [Marinicella sediminis]